MRATFSTLYVFIVLHFESVKFDDKRDLLIIYELDKI